jgi:hypothetical protein
MGEPFPIFIQIGCTEENTACPLGVTVAQDSDFAGVVEDTNKLYIELLAIPIQFDKTGALQV